MSTKCSKRIEDTRLSGVDIDVKVGHDVSLQTIGGR
jgi:hypothetical protein